MDKQSATSMKPASRVRPGVNEKRTDAEPRVYCELPSFPSFNKPVPNEVSLEELCAKYPNHLRGSYLDAFIQWHWSATDIYSCLTAAALDEFKTFGITTSKSFANRANFLMKRLDARLSTLSAEQVTGLCTAPKIRSCMIDGTEKYGASKLQGKFHNPNAEVVRRYPHRQDKERRPPQPSASTRPLVHNDKEYQLWGSAEEFQGFKQIMATFWSYQRVRVEQIIDGDAKYRASHYTQRKRLILKMTNWPCNDATETFFSFQHIQDCPAFESAIFDMVAAATKTMLDAPLADDSSEQLPVIRQSAVSYVLAGQEARLTCLNNFWAASLAGEFADRQVDQVLEWTADLDGESSEVVDPVPDAAETQGGDASFFLQTYLDVQTAPSVGVPAPSRSNLKRQRSNPAIAAIPAKRVRFADAIAESAPTDPGADADFSLGIDVDFNQGADVDFGLGADVDFGQGADLDLGLGADVDLGLGADLDVNLQAPQLDTETDMLLPNWYLNGYPTPANNGDVALTPNPTMDEMLEGFNMESLQWDPLEGYVDAGINHTGAESERAQVLSEAGTQAEAVSNMDENETAPSWELPELVDDDPEWLTEAIGNAAQAVPNMDENKAAPSWELPELVDSDPDWWTEAVQNAAVTPDGSS